MSETEDYIKQLQQQSAQQQIQSQQLQQQVTQNMFEEGENENLIRWQLDIKEELSRIERLLRKQIAKRDDKGNIYWEDPKDDKDKLFNEHGVQEILNLLNWYLNKNIILSNFTIKEVKVRMHQFGIELTDFIFNSYESFGLNTKDKIKHFPMIVTNIINTVEAAYHRALEGGERESLNKKMSVLQTEPLRTQEHLPQMNSQKFSLFRPNTWTR